MIDTNFLRRRRAPIRQLRLALARRGSVSDGATHGGSLAAAERSARKGRLAGEEGVTLIEVMVSTLMVGFIAVATFNGFSVATDATASNRFHNQATVLAAQSLEQLRTDSAATLDEIQNPGRAHVYTQTIGGETYKIAQSSEWINDAHQSAGCSAVSNEHSNQAGNYLKVYSVVTWPQQEAAKEKAVEEFSLITPPDGSGLEVDALNGLIPEQPVAGVTVIAGEAEATTGLAGCVILGGIPATRINVEAFKVGDVIYPTDTLRKVFPEVLIVPNLTTHVEVLLNQGAAITAEFFHENEKKEITPATGDTFVARNSELEPAPNFELGSTNFGAFGEKGEYDALPAGNTGSGLSYPEAEKAYKPEAKTPISSEHYPTGDLFPFENAWTAYAGDCPANSPNVADPTQFPSVNSIPSVAPVPGEDAPVKVPTSYVLLNAYSGTNITHGSLESTSLPVKITNTVCKEEQAEKEKETKKTYIPDNASPSSYSLVHLQNTNGGHLEAPYQPFGKVVSAKQPFKLCLYDEKTKETYTTEYANETEAGSTINLYLKETTAFESTIGHSVKVATGQSTDTC